MYLLTYLHTFKVMWLHATFSRDQNDANVDLKIDCHIFMNHSVVGDPGNTGENVCCYSR